MNPHANDGAAAGGKTTYCGDCMTRFVAVTAQEAANLCRDHECRGVRRWPQTPPTYDPVLRLDPEKLEQAREFFRRAVLDEPAVVVDVVPDTSAAAAIDIAQHVGTMRLRVAECIFGRGTRGATCDEVEALLNMRHQSASARMRELHLAGWIQRTGTTRATRSGSQAAVWVSVRGVGHDER